MKATAQIFLSYAREDGEKIEDLYQQLSDAGFTPWMAERDILPGERWPSSIQGAIRCSHFFLACLSANSIGKRGWIQKEIKQALDILQEMLPSDIYLIPVRLEDCEVPESLRDIQWVNLFEESGWTRLAEAIRVGMERRAPEIKPTPEEGLEQQMAALHPEAVGLLEAKERQKTLNKLAEVPVAPPWVPVWVWVAIGGAILLAVVGGWVFRADRGGEVKSKPTVVQATIPAVAFPTSTPMPATPTPPQPTATPIPPTPKPVPPTATPLPRTPTSTPTQTPVPPTGTATNTPRPIAIPTPTPTATDTPGPPTLIPTPTATLQAISPITLTIYLRRTETDFVELSDDQVNKGLYMEGQFVYGEAAVQIGATTYHFDKPEVGPGEPEQLPDPWRVEFEFAEALVARIGNQAGFDPKKAQFWVGTLDDGSAVGEDNPYSLTMKLYEGNELRESIQVFFTVADAPGGGRQDGTPTKPKP